jgi:leader peptidase (prepilin peptidase)/N-methyltransferase
MNLIFLLDIWGVLAGALFLACLAWISITDIRKRLIPNQVILTMLILGLLNMGLAIFRQQDWWQIPAGLLIALPFLGAWLRGWMGAGDVKLILACGFFLGLPACLAMIALMLALLIVIAIFLAVSHRSMKTKIPLGPAIATACSCVIIVNLIGICLRG